jgi:drug/metabolite transporter (DMT)-like permease
MNDKRWLGIGLAVAAAALLLYAALSRAWLHNPRLGISFGPGGCNNCCYLVGDAADGCSLSNEGFVDSMRAMAKKLGDAKAMPTSSAFAPMGWTTYVLCIVGALGLLATAALALAKRRPQLPISPASIALLAIMMSLITGCVFVATKPGPAGFVGVANGFWAFGIGTVAGIAGAQMLAKLIRPVDPDLLDDAMNPEQY